MASLDPAPAPRVPSVLLTTGPCCFSLNVPLAPGRLEAGPRQDGGWGKLTGWRFRFLSGAGKGLALRQSQPRIPCARPHTGVQQREEGFDKIPQCQGAQEGGGRGRPRNSAPPRGSAGTRDWGQKELRGPHALGVAAV